MHRLVDDLRVVTIHFMGGGPLLRATLVELHHQPQGWAMVLKDERFVKDVANALTPEQIRPGS